MPSLLQILNLENVKKVFRNISKVGLVTTIRYVLSDLVFDYKYKVDTINTKTLDELEIDSPNKSRGNYYEGTNSYVFKLVFSRIKTDPQTGCFVDFGSGKGKAMFLAAEMGFREVIGVEFSRELVDVCNKNLEIFKKRAKTKTQFTVVHGDASEYPIPPHSSILFFSNPFNEELTLKVAANILASYQAHPREIWIPHLYPQGNMAFAKFPEFECVYAGRDWSIYRLG